MMYQSITGFLQRTHVRVCMTLYSTRIPNARSKLKDYYAILQVKPSASQHDIREAFLSLSKQYHPDAAGDNEKLKVKFVEIAEAFSVLGKPESRREYDANRKLLILGLLGDGFRMDYPKPSPDMDSIVLQAYQEEMRRRWNERLQEWAQAQGAFELERGISMDQVRDVTPQRSHSDVFDRENRLYIFLASAALVAAFGYLYHVI